MLSAAVGRPTRPRPDSRTRGPVRAQALRLALAVGAAWALAAGSYALHLAWVVPVIVLLGAAALLRGGGGLLDRIVMAAALLYGALCVGGLLLSVWPWHLHPVAVGGAALTALVVVAHVAGRWPWLPRPALADALSLAAAAIVGILVAVPLLGRGQETRLAILIAGEDGVRHATMIDAIRQVGGYLFLHPHQAAEHVYSGMVHYPQGAHLLFGVLDGFVRSSGTDPGSSLSVLDHYLGYAVLGYAALALAVAWAVQRLAQPAVTPARRVVLVAFAVAFLLSSQSFVTVVLQYLPQMLGLALVAVLVAVLARPPARTGRALWLVAALLVGIGSTYYLYLPPAVLAVLVWAFARRHRVRRHPLALAATVVAILVSAVPAVVGVTVARQDAALLVAAPPPSWDGLLVAAGLAGAGLLRSWAVPRWRVFRWALGSTVLAFAGLTATQWVQAGAGGYYYANKLLTLVMLMLALAAGSLLAFLPPPVRAGQTRGAMLRRAASAGALVLVLAAGSGLVVGDSPYQAGGSVMARAWVTGAFDYHRYAARTALSELGREIPPGTVTLVMRADPAQAYHTQLLVSAVLRQSGPTGPAVYPGRIYEPGRYDHMVAALATRPVLIVVDSAATWAEAELIRARHPDQDITIAMMAG